MLEQVQGSSIDGPSFLSMDTTQGPEPLTVTSTVQASVNPAASFTVSVTICLPISAHVKSVLLKEYSVIPQLSVLLLFTSAAVSVYLPSLVNVMAKGDLQEAVGASLSLTTTFCVHSFFLPAPSVNVHVIVVVPTG
ncbi:MAG: hypothetical protein KIPDCIKN_04119 [Haliscomenobacter sp.]|nr:hypothetical protein [Haliscomenobacter sp.]